MKATKKRAEPYTKIVGEMREVRRETVELLRKAVDENRLASVLVNNRAEGNAPLTVQALSENLTKNRGPVSAQPVSVPELIVLRGLAMCPLAGAQRLPMPAPYSHRV